MKTVKVLVIAIAAILSLSSFVKISPIFNKSYTIKYYHGDVENDSLDVTMLLQVKYPRRYNNDETIKHYPTQRIHKNDIDSYLRTSKKEAKKDIKELKTIDRKFH